MYRPHGTEALVLVRVLALGVEDVGTDDGCEVVEVHLGSRLLVDVGEGGDPLEEDEECLHRVAVGFGEEAAYQVHDLLPLLQRLDPWSDRVSTSSRERMEELTLRSDKEMEELERHERIGQVPQESLEERSELDGVLVGEVDGGCVSVERFAEILQSTNVAILPEDSLDGHIYMEPSLSGMREGKWRRTHLLHRRHNVVDKTWYSEGARSSAVHRVGTVPLDKDVQRDTEYTWEETAVSIEPFGRGCSKLTLLLHVLLVVVPSLEELAPERVLPRVDDVE